MTLASDVLFFYYIVEFRKYAANERWEKVF